MLVQMAILLFYLRIFVFQMDRLAAYIMMGVVLCWWFASLLGTFLICKPISYSWNRDQNGSCGSVIELWTATSISHIIIDIMILSLPLPMVWKLQLPFLTKVGLSAIFGLGFLYDLSLFHSCLLSLNFPPHNINLTPSVAFVYLVGSDCALYVPTISPTCHTPCPQLTLGACLNPLSLSQPPVCPLRVRYSSSVSPHPFSGPSRETPPAQNLLLVDSILMKRRDGFRGSTSTSYQLRKLRASAAIRRGKLQKLGKGWLERRRRWTRSGWKRNGRSCIDSEFGFSFSVQVSRC